MAVASGVATLIAAEIISKAVTAEINRTAESEAITGFMSEQMNIGLTVVGLVITAGAGFVLFNSIAMSVAQQRADLGRLRSLGMTQIQIISMIVLESLLLGLAGALVGCLLGITLGRGLIWLLESTSEIFNQFGQADLSVMRLLGSAGLGILISLGAAFGPALSAARMAPIEAMRLTHPLSPASHASRWPIVGLLGSLVLWAYLVIAPPGRWILPQTANILTVVFILVWLGCIVALLPGFVDLIGRTARSLLLRLSGGVGWIAGDNLRRAKVRVGLAIMTLAVAIGMIVAVSGFLAYWFDELFFRTPAQNLSERPAVGFFPLDVERGLEAYRNVSGFTMPQGFRQQVEPFVGNHGSLVEAYFVLAPELSFLGENYFSYVLRVEDIRDAGDFMFTFSYGSWEQAEAWAAESCVLFVTPNVAQKNDAWLGDWASITTPAGSLDCRIAGIGPTNVGASIISSTALSNYMLSAPVGVIVFPYSDQDREAMLPDLQALADATPGAWLVDVARMTEIQQTGMKSIQIVMNGMLILAVLAAAFGIVNLTVITILERRRELGILRSIGAQRSQLQRMLAVEGWLTGLIGSIVGSLFGLGLVLGYVLISAGSPMGFPDFPVWQAAWNSARAGLGPALVSIVCAPWLTALSAGIPARQMVQESIIALLGVRQHLT
jgi:putative ABC transport system permease protein